MVLEYSVISSVELEALQSQEKPVENVSKNNDVIVNIVEPTPVAANANYDTIVEYMPKTFIKRSKRILSIIEKHPNIIRINSDGFLMINNVLQDGSEIQDLISSLLTTLPRKYPPIGIQGFLAAMGLIKLPLSLIANQKYRKMVANYAKTRQGKKTKVTKKQQLKKYY